MFSPIFHLSYRSSRARCACLALVAAVHEASNKRIFGMNEPDAYKAKAREYVAKTAVEPDPARRREYICRAAAFDILAQLTERWRQHSLGEPLRLADPYPPCVRFGPGENAARSVSRASS